MEEPVSTPKLPAQVFQPAAGPASNKELLSSSPGFGTPAYPLASRPAGLKQPFAHQITTSTSTIPTVLPTILPRGPFQRVAVRTLKKHNLELHASALELLSSFVGKFCGSGWRDQGLADRVLDEIAKQWKKQGGEFIVKDGPDKRLSSILKTIEPCMAGGRLDMGKLSRINSATGSVTLSRENSFSVRPSVTRDDSQTSLGLSGLDVDDPVDREPDEDLHLDPRTYLKVISAFDQPRLAYSTSKKSLDPVAGGASILPPIQHKVAMFRNRYNLVHQRLMRNELFQTPSFSTVSRPPGLVHSGSAATTIQQAYKITPISNLLGRSGSSHLLLGMLVHSAAGDLSLTDLSGSVVLDIAFARAVPDDAAWFCPGMMVLVEGMYEEDGSHNSNLGSAAGVGGQIKGHFLVDTVAGPPAERRNITIGVADAAESHAVVSAGFGWVDFLGVGSEKAMGLQMRRIQKAAFSPPSDADDADDEQSQLPRTKIAVVSECNLDSPRTLEAIRSILSSYSAASPDVVDLPLSIILMGNFASAAAMTGSTQGGGSVEYKERFDALASVMAEFPTLLATTSFIFVPGDNDPWPSAFSAGGACLLPRQGIPDVFTTRIRRAITTANAENVRRNKKDAPGEAIWATNPARLSLFGPLEEIVLFRDDITSRFRRHAITFPKPNTDADDQPQSHPDASHEDSQGPDTDMADKSLASIARATTPLVLTDATAPPTLAAARKVVKTLLDQSHLAPFLPSIRPLSWDHAGAVSLYPLPTALVLADAETPAFAITYEGCHVMNPGRVVDELGLSRTTARGAGTATWVEYDVSTRRGEVREVRF